MRPRVLILLALVWAACGEAEKSPRDKWLGATWVPVSGEIRGVMFEAQVPEGLPENKEFVLGRDWWVGTDRGDFRKELERDPVAAFSRMIGPRLTLSVKDRKADLDELVREHRPETELGRGKLPDGRVRLAWASKDGQHLDVETWLAVGGEGVLSCSANWLRNIGKVVTRVPKAGQPRPSEKDTAPDREIVAWLDRFCASVRVTGVTTSRSR